MSKKKTKCNNIWGYVLIAVGVVSIAVAVVCFLTGTKSGEEEDALLEE